MYKLGFQGVRSPFQARTAGARCQIDGRGQDSCRRTHVGGLALAALGVVFGDIGTSPLYTFKTILDLTGNGSDHDTILGLVSLLVWTLLLTTSLKYVTFVMRIDNDGEGGILALMALLGVKPR